jgi:vancomycin resistance protein YoaR
MIDKSIKYFIILVFCFGFGIGISLAETKINEPIFQEALSKKIAADLTLKINGDEYKLTSTEISRWIKEKTDLAVVPGYSSEIENGHYCAYKKSILCALSFGLKNEFQIKKSSLISLDEDLMAKYITDLARTANKDSEDAKFKIEDGKVSTFSLDKKGIKLNEEKSLETLVKYFKEGNISETLVLPYEEIKPQVNIDSVDNMGITDLIGEGRSNFRGSPKNRIFNIKVATSRYDGVLIQPGEEFSFVHVLGEVDGEHGYLPELVIKKDKTEPEFGGGICQVSTTAFRAAINSGLEITARRNHAYPVAYYNPQGMDATVYVPRPDLKFKNDTPNYILIQTKIEGTELIFDFYGTSDGRQVEVIGPKVIEKNPDGSMKTTFTQKVSDKDGKLIREDIFNSSYDSPSKYPHPGTTADALTQKPNGWSDREWKDYKSAHGL